MAALTPPRSAKTALQDLAVRDVVGTVRARAETSSERKGSGLGLSITRAILENMGGEIGFTVAPGRTTFHFELPEWRARGVARQRLAEGDPCLASR